MASTAVHSTRRIRRVLSTRAGGVSDPPYGSFNLGAHVGDEPVAVERNRRRLADGIGLPSQRLIWMEQVHGRGVVVVHQPTAATVPMADALVTATPGLALNVLTADCVPLLLWDEQAEVIGAAHAGRQGVRLGIAAATVRKMVGLGAQPANIEALLGPAICGGCYEVPPTMQADVEAAAPGSAVRTRSGSAGLDLRAGLVAQLAAAGVGKVQCDHRCTAEDETLYSYRREAQTGRQTAVIWIQAA